jgi:hypothetical protein
MVCSTVPQGHAASMDLQDSIAKDFNESDYVQNV